MSSITALQSTLTVGITDVQKNISKIQTQLATNTKDLDPGQLGQVTRLSSQVTGYNSAVQNIAQARSAIAVSQTALTSINDLMTQLTDLANKSASGSLNAADRTNLNVTFQALVTQIDGIASNATVNGVNLVGSGAAALKVQTGLTSADSANIATAISGTTGLGLTAAAATTAGTVALNPSFSAAVTTFDITTANNASVAVTLLNTALATLSSNQSALAAADAGLAAKSKTDASIATNLQSAIDAIQKPDQAALQMELTQANNQQSIDYYLISQMNTASQSMLSIFR